ncbi:MAG: sigma-70 family RNA polymerase sigma factor, partial [Bacillales bacterium]
RVFFAKAGISRIIGGYGRLSTTKTPDLRLPRRAGMVYKAGSDMNEKELFERIRSGDEKALEFLYKKYYRMMTKMVITNSGTEEEARDIYQDALIVFWQKATSGNLVMTSKISTYIYSICQNLWRKELDRKKRLSSETNDTPVSIDTDSAEREKIIARCINQLGETCKKVLMYYYFEEMSMQDIAEKLGFANTDTAKTKKYKCKKKLDELIKAQYSERDFLD